MKNHADRVRIGITVPVMLQDASGCAAVLSGGRHEWGFM